MMRRIKYSLLGMCIVPLFGRIALHGSGHESDIYRYIMPMLVGAIAGFLIGMMKDRLLKSADGLRSVLDSVPYGTIECDSTGSILFSNNAVREMLHMSENDIRRHKIWDLCEKDNCRKKVEDVFGNMLQTKKTPEPFITSLKSADETNVLVEVYWTHQRANGDFNKGATATIIDITSQEASQNLLKKLSRVVEHSKEVIIITDKQGTIEYVNPAFFKVTGYTASEALGKKTSMLKSDAQDALVYKELWQTIEAGDVWSGSLIDRRKDGEFYPVDMTITPIFGDNKEVTNYVAIQSDMSEKKLLEEQFLQSQKMESLGTLVGGIAHDFNNMLAAIQGNVYLAKTEIGNPTSISKRLSNIDSVSDRAASVVRQLLTFARKGSIKTEQFSLNSFMGKGYQLAKTMIPEDVDHITDYCKEELIVEGDPTQLQQVLMNLANNACHAVSNVKKPKITCRIRPFAANDAFMKKHAHLRSSQYAKISVSDNGCGIKKENLDRIIEPFFTTKGVGEGTGLGLSMVYGSVQNHGGVFEIESELGKGTTCHVYLPLVESPDLQSASHEKHTSVQGNGETILLVDDEKELLETASQVLTHLNYNVLVAADGKEAFDIYKNNSNSISLVLTDITMPKMNGFELMDKIWKENNALPVIFATGYDKNHHKLPSGKEAQAHIISKPYFSADTSRLIHSLLS